MQYVLLFLEGIITFISPCLLPMLPIYISYFAAGETDKRKTMLNASAFVLGFTIVFVTMGALAGTVGGLLIRYKEVVNIVAGLIMIVFGLNFIGLLKIGLLNRISNRGAAVKTLGFFPALLFGMAFSISWTPCVGAFLGSALLIASLGGSLLKGIAMLLTFSLGLGIPFFLSALLIDQLKDTFDFIKRNYQIINYISGGLLIIVGLLMATGYVGYFLSLLTF
ncbi:MAG: cytochrome c biogenesis protein CcdA [Firmicutes bacterium]|nr:cytochrome c biogenesis protein CcdA [Bacillota bacterium]